MKRKKAVTIHLPFTEKPLPPGEKLKPLCFLADIGFLALFVRWGGTCIVDQMALPLEVAEDTASGLTEASLQHLEKLGYRRKAYKDHILLPLSIIQTKQDVENLKQAMEEYVSSWLKYYEHEIAEGNFIEVFYKELAENTVEHAEGASAFVCARLLRSVWDMAEEQRKIIFRRRGEGKLKAMEYFLNKYENEGFLELVVVDNGPGIVGTLPLPEIEAGKKGGIYRYAMRPHTSRYDLSTRLGRDKNPLTGLGQCSSCLERLPGVLMFREMGGGAYCFRDEKQDRPEMVNLTFTQMESYEGERTQGCNIQLAIAIPALSTLPDKAEKQAKGDVVD